jgi:protein-S-isoprenylcysteine O-methyltransferase Ste14
MRMPFPDSLSELRAIIATVLLALYLPVPVYLIVLHGLNPLWRRLGTISYVPLLLGYSVCVYAVVRLHELWPWRAWPWPTAISGLAPLALAAAAVLAYATYRTIPPATLHLVQQIRPDNERKIITTGVLGRMRHPRYLMFSLIALGNALATGYPLVWVSLLVTLGLFGVVIRLEERELHEYFGDEYAEYCAKVPAFFPIWKRGK